MDKKLEKKLIMNKFRISFGIANLISQEEERLRLLENEQDKDYIVLNNIDEAKEEIQILTDLMNSIDKGLVD